ncbi:hypothetical protein WJX79_009686 [Trebouxia sp. C0005]
MQLPLGSVYKEPGYFGSTTALGKSSPVTINATLPGGGSIDTSTVTTTPYVIHYTAEDALGNIAVPVSRSVSVYNPCTPQAYCTASDHLFYKVGLTPCELATASASLGTTIVIPFSVYDDGSPQLKATVNRTILVVSPCSAEAKAVVNSSHTLVLTYAVPVAFNLMPCPSSGEQTDCAVYALDGLGDDISNSITYVTSNPSCTATSAADLTCPMCAVQYMQQGLCLPGRYLIEYSASDSSGAAAAPLTISITFVEYVFVVSNDTAAESTETRRKLLQSTALDTWEGYLVAAAASSTTEGAGTLAQQLLRKRYVGITGSNKVVGALEVQQIMESQVCQSTRFNKLAPVCGTVQVVGIPNASALATGDVEPASASGGIGLDPVFQTWSNLWSLDVTGEQDQYYNMTQGSGDVDSVGNPYGFTQTPLAQHTPSYPLLVTTQMSRDRSVDQLILMSDGRYLSSITSSMTLRLVSYNADAQSLAFVRFPFEWQDAGVIVGGPPYILALPVLAYSSYAYSRWRAIIPDVLVMLVMAVFGVNVVQRIRQVTHKDHRHLWQILYERTGLLLDAAILVLQVSSVLVFVTYALVQANQLGGSTPTYDVYDSDNYPLAHYPLIQRVESAEVANGTATQAGGPNRYLLQANYTGMEGFETFLFNTSVLYNLLVVYALVQALVLILMLCSFIQRWYIPVA